jgi:hypothetical protein
MTGFVPKVAGSLFVAAAAMLWPGVMLRAGVDAAG